VSTVLVATSFPVVASIAGAMNSAVLVVARFALAAALFLPLVVLRHGRRALPTPGSILRYAVLSAPLVGFFVGMFEALRTTTAVNTAALFTLVPSFAAVASLVLLGERPPARRVAGLALGTLGAIWVVLRGDLGALAELRFAIGDAYFVAGVASLAVYSTLVKRLHRGEPMEVMTLWTLVTGTAWLLAVRWDQIAAVRPSDLEPRVLGPLAYLAVFTTLITFLLAQSATLALGPTRTMAYTYLNPALVAGIAWVLGGDVLGWAAVPGIALTLAAMLVLQREGRRSELGARGGAAHGAPEARAPALRRGARGSRSRSDSPPSTRAGRCRGSGCRPRPSASAPGASGSTS